MRVFLVLECGLVSWSVEVLLAFLESLLIRFTESLVLLPEGDSDEVDGLIPGVFEVAVRDVYVAVETRELAEGHDLVLALVVRVVDSGEVVGLDLFVEGFL